MSAQIVGLNGTNLIFNTWKILVAQNAEPGLI